MDTKMKLQKSLPPLVEGKIRGYLKLTIDEVIWSERSFGEIKVFVRWWGETDKSEFRPADITKDIVRSIQDTTEIYVIHTNINLFEEYIKNCESLELIVVSEETDIIIGKSEITDLLEIFKCKSYFRYVPIITNSGHRIGEIHVSMKLDYMTKSFNMQLKAHKSEEKPMVDNTLLSVINSIKNQHGVKSDKYGISRKIKPDENETYKSILKLRRTEFQEPINKVNNAVADKLVAQVVARAQKLRGALSKETSEEDESIFGDNSLDHIPKEDEVKLHEYFLGEDIMPSDENKTLHTLSLPDTASSELKVSKYNSKSITNNLPSARINSLIEDTLLQRRLCIDMKDLIIGPLNSINYIRINVESFTLSPAGYRRVKSSSLSNNDNTFLSATYFVQYDMTFDYMREPEKKLVKQGKGIRICSKKQTDQVIYFNHSSTYGVLNLKQYTERLIKFKIFVRHFNKKSSIELGSVAICIDDVVKNENWRLPQQLIIVNKGIKIGELSVTIELGSNSSHLEKQHIDNIISTKGNIPTLETQQLLNETRNKKSQSATKSQSKTSNEVSTNSVINSLNTDSDLVITKRVQQFATESIDDKRIDMKNHEHRIEDKVLLHGLIYVAEGQNLPELNTYLICRAFWREDKTRSQVCNNTTNPFYQFFQLVPLIYDSDLLERIKDNYIIIEVYFKKNNVDSLLGIAKLSVHQLYIAYRDPRVLPHLLLCKYPVVSVDGWVPIVNPVTGQSCGQLLALVALGTAEQIALLEMSRGLRTIGTIPQMIQLDKLSGCSNHSRNEQQWQSTQNRSQSNKDAFSQNNSHISATDIAERDLCFLNSRSQECQTDISTVKEFKFNDQPREKASSLKYSHDTADQLAQTLLNVNKINIDQAAQTEEMCFKEKEQIDTEEQTCVNELNFNNSSDDSDSGSIRHNFRLPTEAYRSVGVGAEYNEEIDQQPTSSHNNTTFELPTPLCTENESTNSTYSQTVFRALVEIECALHLPKVEKINEAVEPSTYVSFQANKSNHTKHTNPYTITNVFPHSCNPKWDWKCDTELPIELLLHDEKRLILKIWRILDPDVSMQINLERDVVIGFSAIDLSILISGFPTVSGWFHIMDFTGKCNGQIKVSITPLDNLSLFVKSMTVANTTRPPACSMSQLNWVPVHAYETHCGDTERNNTNYTLSTVTQEEEKSVHTENHSNDSAFHIGMEDVSMSFLSLSLKQKLTELDEITKRLESRLRDVTNTAFEDDLENDFEPNELNSDHENNDYKTAAPVASTAMTDYNGRVCRTSQVDKKLHTTESKENRSQSVSNETSIQSRLSQTYAGCNKAVNCEIMKSNSSVMSNSYANQNLLKDNNHMQQPGDLMMQNFKTFDSAFADYPERGTRTHINYLLDKLSLQFPTESYLTKPMPTRKNVISLLTNLKSSNNKLQDSNTCNQELKICTVPTQTDNMHEQTIENPRNSVTNCATNTEDDAFDKTSLEVSMQSQIANKMSKVIREELIAEENSNTRCDELTTYLVTSNIRHMDLNNMFNPLFYQHLVPDLHYSNTSPEEESVKQLDNRYSKVFSRLDKINNSGETNVALENAELFRATPSGVSENIDDSIDLTILHKASYNNLLASNSTDSTTTISIEKSLKSIDSEVIENGDSTSSETSVLVLSRQAPDGGNPVEDNRKPLIAQQEDDTQQNLASSSTCN